MRKLVFVVGSLLAVLMTGAAGAYFTAETSVAENVVRAGTVSVSAEPTSSALTVDALAPGSVVTRSLSVMNDGSLPCDIVVTAAKKAGITDFYEALTVRVTSGGSLLYEGALTGMRTTPLQLVPGARVDLDFAIGLPSTAGNDLAGDYVKLTVYVDAEQLHS